MEFHVTWPNGQTETDNSETTSADAYAMERWGCTSAEQVWAQYGVRINTTPDQPAPAQEPPAPELTPEQVAALQQAEQTPEEAPVQ